MPQIPDLVADSRLRFRFLDNETTVHTFIELDKTHRQIQREEFWKRERYIGRGGFARVQLEKCIAGEKRGSLRAVKVIEKQPDSTKSTYLNRELEAIAKFSHDRYKVWFIKSFGWYENHNSIFLTMEYCPHGDLHHYFSNQLPAPVAEAQQLTHQVLGGLHHMHENSFAHRDLKPGNILIKSIPPETWRVVLADFGISKRAEASNGPSTIRGIVKGTEQFMAPELRDLVDLSSPDDTPDYKAGDMWALGEIAFRMLTGRTTFQNIRQLMEYCQGKREYPSDQLPSSAGDDGKDFISRLMIIDPSSRMTTAQSLCHRWMASQYETIDEHSTQPHLDQTNISGIVTSNTTQNASARWTLLSNTQQIRPTAERRSARSSPVSLYEEDSGQTEIAQTYQDLSVSHVGRNITATLSFAKAAPISLIGHQISISSIAFSPDGKTLASGSHDTTIRLQNNPSAAVSIPALDAVFKTLKGHSGGILAIAFSPDGLMLASGSLDKTIRLWDTRSGALLKTLEGHSDDVIAATFLPDGRTLTSGSRDRTIRLWDIRSGATLRTIRSDLDGVCSIAFSPDVKILAWAGTDGNPYIPRYYWIELLDAQSGATLKSLNTDSDFYVDFSQDGRTLVTVSFVNPYESPPRHGEVRLWDVRSGDLLKRFELRDGCAAAYSPDNMTLASLTARKIQPGFEIQIMDIRKPDAKWRRIGDSSWKTQVLAFSPDGKRLAAGGFYGDIRLCNI